ncbi:porin [Paraburkholderia phytofirmans]|uniref:Porin Gram-negative type n=1 Tax=Paraburkholderia phytofirmans (strain DSM 17436 / LMG 22146 / PsJN) TaxID=398527 RepID=B2TEX2_PARPJ|nr:porin [Paraburkholderia phytofirmans]ACD18643.1 porin Gram-negative type [Paraburkholderia phytofirmans PsJN]
MCNQATSMAIGLCASIVLACTSQATMAQSSVTLYGILDVSVQLTTRADGQHSAINLQNYGSVPTIFGLHGSEDLGGGVSAIFELSQSFSMTNGKSGIPGDAFGWQSYVGLKGGFGTVTAGRQFSVLFDETVMFDPTYFAAYGGQAQLNPLSDIIVNNSIKYLSNSYGGFVFEGLISTDGVAGNFASGRTLELGMQYSRGPFNMSVALREKNGSEMETAGSSGKTERIGVIGAAYKIGPATLLAGVERTTGDLSPVKTVIWGGGRYDVTPALQFRAAVYQTLSKNPQTGDPTLYVAGAVYSLSVRTQTYLNVGYSRNSAHSSQTVYEYGDAPLNGANQFAVMLGITHKF